MNDIINKWKRLGIGYWYSGECRGDGCHGAKNEVEKILVIGERDRTPIWEIAFEAPRKLNEQERIKLWVSFPEDYDEEKRYLYMMSKEEVDKEFETLQSANEYAFKMVKDYLKRHSKEK